MSTSQQPSVAVIGAGITGSYVAYELARAGCEVEVVDPLDAPNASSGNAGMLALSFAKPMSNPSAVVTGLGSLLGRGHGVEVSRPLTASTLRWLVKFGIESRPFRATRAAPVIHAMARRSLELYDELAATERVDLRFRRTGWLHVARSPEALRKQTRLAHSLAPVGIRSQPVTAAELTTLEPAIGGGHCGGVLYPDDVSIDPGYVTATVADMARRHGARFTAARVVGADLRAGRVVSMETDDKSTLRKDYYVLATGGDTADVGRLLGQRISIERGYGWSLVLPTDGRLAHRALMGIEDHVVINAGPDSVRITGGMQFGGRPGTIPAAERITELRRAAELVMPPIKDIVSEGTAWRGARPMTASGLPIVSQVNNNTVAVTGHGTLGMTIAPFTARQCRDVVLGST